MGATGGRTPPSKITVLLLATSIISAVWAAAMLTPFGRVAYVYFFAYSEFYMGVLSLVSLSITIMIGLVATDRLVLSIRQRVLLQSAHRTTGVIAVAALGLHLWTKLMEGHIRAIDMFVPFLSHGYNRIYVGLGTISALIMVTVMWTGLVRARFVGRGKPWMWRSIHAVSYLMWPIALVHGLSAGRPAATWVIVSYVVCVLGVLIGLAVRLSVSLNRRKDFASTSTGSIKPVGSLVPTNSPGLKKRPGRRADPDSTGPRVVAERGDAPEAALETWVPATPPVGAPAAAPVSAPAYDDAPYRRQRRPTSYAEDDAPRGRRRAEPRYGDPRYDERTESVSRRYADEDEPRRRRADDEIPYGPESRYDDAPRRRRYAADEPTPRPSRDEQAPRPSRHAEEDDEPRYDPALRSRRHAEDDDEPRYDPAPRSRRRNDEDRNDDAPRRRGTGGVRTTGEFPAADVGYDSGPPAGRARSARYAGDDGPARYAGDDRLSRYAEDGDAAPRARRDRGANADRAGSGRHSRSEFVDLSTPADPWGATDDPNYVPPDETPTLVDMASRRARKAAQQQDAARGGSRTARRSRSRGDDNDVADVQYWRQLRGEAR
jgi:hypothetical protein